ncbi:hypothetical protein [Acidovorax sp. PRC11]|uniref:hypothetical protein n=1 Tax=Acidovorax sp. PRC11 TaxID=2962592 RepID=UPI0028815C80|nr:hypothetical protein [Acidovorax sp. PRC11]MDT0137728.1 hypothetical protein [Acidovorax sp. PRC11]
MNEDLRQLRALNLATHTLLLQLVLALKHSGSLDCTLLRNQLNHARNVLEEGGDPVDIQASLLLEHLVESVLER